MFGSCYWTCQIWEQKWHLLSLWSWIPLETLFLSLLPNYSFGRLNSSSIGDAYYYYYCYYYYYYYYYYILTIPMILTKSVIFSSTCHRLKLGTFMWQEQGQKNPRQRRRCLYKAWKPNSTLSNNGCWEDEMVRLQSTRRRRWRSQKRDWWNQRVSDLPESWLDRTILGSRIQKLKAQFLHCEISGLNLVLSLHCMCWKIYVESVLYDKNL